MPPNANSSRRAGASVAKTVRHANVKKGNSVAVDDHDPILQPSQSSSDDGIMATIAQQMQASIEKKKKEREVKFLQAAQAELSKIFTEKAQDLTDGIAEIDKIYADFREAYATNEDQIQKLWAAILEEQRNLHVFIEETRTASLECDKRREKEHIQALAHCRKACEESQRLIDSLSSS